MALFPRLRLAPVVPRSGGEGTGCSSLLELPWPLEQRPMEHPGALYRSIWRVSCPVRQVDAGADGGGSFGDSSRTTVRDLFGFRPFGSFAFRPLGSSSGLIGRQLKPAQRRWPGLHDQPLRRDHRGAGLYMTTHGTLSRTARSSSAVVPSRSATEGAWYVSATTLSSCSARPSMTTGPK